MFNKLLVPLDGTTEAAAALPAATTLARGTGASITLVRVPARGGSPAEALMGDHIAEHELRATADELATDDLKIDWLIGTPPAAPFIIDAVAARDADVIVMATHGRNGLARAFAGSVSEGVVVDSGRFVPLLKPDGKRLHEVKTLLVPVDGTAGGALALSAAVALARASRGPLGARGRCAAYASVDGRWYLVRWRGVHRSRVGRGGAARRAKHTLTV